MFDGWRELGLEGVQIASQFAKMKRILSVVFGIFLLGETLESHDWIAFVPIGIGVCILAFSQPHSK